jgi:hypothetical protein
VYLFVLLGLGIVERGGFGVAAGKSLDFFILGFSDWRRKLADRERSAVSEYVDINLFLVAGLYDLLQFRKFQRYQENLNLNIKIFISRATGVTQPSQAKGSG